MPRAVILAYIFYALITSFTPGPNIILALNSTLTFGLRRSRRLIAGIAVGLFLALMLCGALSLSLKQLDGTALSWMKYIGAAYILWLIVHVLRSKPSAAGSTQSGAEAAEKPPPSFITGLLLQFVNVKILLYGFVTLASFVLPYRSDIPFVLLFVLIMTCSLNAGLITWSLAGSLFQDFFNRHYRLVNIVMAAVLLQSMAGLLLN